MDAAVRAFYARVLSTLRDPTLRHGTFVPLEVRPAGEGDRSWDGLVAFGWREEGADGHPCLVVIVNLKPEASWARIPLGGVGFERGRGYRLVDRLDGAVYARSGDEVCGDGLFVGLRPRQNHVLVVETE